MVDISVKKMIKTYLNTNPEMKLPVLTGKTSIFERIEETLSSIQLKKINEVLKFPDDALKKPEISNNLKKINEWIAKMQKLKKQGVGRERLVEILPDFADPDSIPKKLAELYAKDPVAAGIYAQKYIGYNPAIDFYHIYEREIEEPFESHIIPQTGDTIRYQLDLLSLNAIYEFKLTTQKNVQNRLKHALAQVYLYDFLFRLKNNIRHYFPLMIEICAIDEQIIYSFGGILSGDTFDVDKQVLKEVFRMNNFNNLELVYQIIDDIYDNLDVCIEEDVDKLTENFKNR